MTKKTGITTGARVLGPHDGDVMGPPEGARDRFMISGEDSDGHVALVEQVMGPRALAAPLHRHTNEDEYNYVLEGKVGALLGEEEVVAEAGHLIFQPRGQWHTFWNAGDVPARTLLIIAPAGLDELFREMGALEGEPAPETIAALAARSGADVDFERTIPIVERHGLSF